MPASHFTLLLLLLHFLPVLLLHLHHLRPSLLYPHRLHAPPRQTCWPDLCRSSHLSSATPTPHLKINQHCARTHTKKGAECRALATLGFLEWIIFQAWTALIMVCVGSNVNRGSVCRSFMFLNVLPVPTHCPPTQPTPPPFICLTGTHYPCLK